MRMFRILLQKELRGYFGGWFIYLLSAAYLSVSIGAAFYFGAYLAMTDTAVYALFGFQPYIMVFLIPALSMRSWAEEYRAGTAEFLLTQPISDMVLAAAKFAASMLFFCFLSLLLIPFVIYTGSWLVIDYANIIAIYCGLFLLIGLFCSLGCLISAATKYMSAAYILTAVVAGIWVAQPNSGLDGAYMNFMFGETGINDFLYFISFTAAFLAINVAVIRYRRAAEKRSILMFVSALIMIMFGTIALNIAAYMLCNKHKFDLTAFSSFTPKEISEEIIAKINKPLEIEVFVAEDYRKKNMNSYYVEQVSRFLQKYEKLSAGMIAVKTDTVEPFSELETSLLQQGLYYEENTAGTKDYFGALLRDREGNGVVISQFLPQRRADLENDVNKALLKLIAPDAIKVIGVYMNPMQNLDQFQGLLLNLENDYKVINVKADTLVISAKLDLLILLNPKGLPDKFMYAVDQYLMNGGKVLIFFDMLSERQSDAVNLQALKITDFLDAWQIKLQDAMTDKAIISSGYAESARKVDIAKAGIFTVENKYLSVTPVLETADGYVGAILTGKFRSGFTDNPIQSAPIRDKMPPHRAVAETKAKLGLIADVDLIEDWIWMADNSVDKNPYGVIAKNDNIRLVRRIIDELSGNTAHLRMTEQYREYNRASIGEQIRNLVAAVYGNEYEETASQLNKKKQLLYRGYKGDLDKIELLTQISTAGEEIAALETKTENLAYQMRSMYTNKVRTMILANVIAYPVAVVLLLLLAVVVSKRIGNRRVKEIINA